MTLFYKHEDKFLIISSLVCCTLVLLRYIISLEYYYFFLIWNLILAAAPLGLTRLLKLKVIPINLTPLILVIWLLFLPNSFYVITDLIHLKYSKFPLYDFVMILFFALLCLYMGFLSMKNVSVFMSRNLPIIDHWVVKTLVLFLCSFGIFLGRFLRYNSWNILDKPLALFRDCISFVKYPMEHYRVWFFTFGFGLALTGLHYIFLKITKSKNAIK